MFLNFLRKKFNKVEVKIEESLHYVANANICPHCGKEVEILLKFSGFGKVYPFIMKEDQRTPYQRGK